MDGTHSIIKAVQGARKAFHRFILRSADTLVILCALLSPVKAAAVESIEPSPLQEEIHRLNKVFNYYPPHPIIIFDKAETTPLLSGRNKPEQKKLLSDYLESRYSLKPDAPKLENLLDYLGPLVDSALSQPFYQDSFTGKVHFCAVFPAKEQYDPVIQVERILGITDKSREAYGEYPVEQLAANVPVEMLRQLSLYHELGHCIDQKYTRITGFHSGFRIHKAEAFAEVFALLMLNREEDISYLIQVRKELRRAYVRHMGPWLAHNHAAASELIQEGGAIYYLNPVIKAVEQQINQNGQALKNLSFESVVDMAQSLVEQNALDGQTYAALVSSNREGANKTISIYKKLAKDDPHLFQETLDHLLQIHTELAQPFISNLQAMCSGKKSYTANC